MATVTFTFSGITGTVTGLTPGQSYTAQVRGVDAAGNRSDLSPPVTFTTTTSADVAATSTPATLAATAALPTPTVGADRTVTFAGTSGQVTGLTVGATYTAQVRAVDAAGNRSDLSTPVNFTTTAGTTVGGSATVAATAQVPGPTVAAATPATRAPGAVAATAAIPTPVKGTIHNFTYTFTDTSGHVTGLPESTSYTARVRARDATGNWSAYSDPIAFTTSVADATASPATVAAAATVPAPEVVAGTAQTFTFPGTTGQLTGLTLGGTYTARVRAVDATGHRSAYSDPITFTTTSGAVGPTVTAGVARPIVRGGSAVLDVTATPPGGQTIAGHSWAIVSGGGTLTNATTATPTYTAPTSGSGLVVIRDTVTASLGGSASADVTVSYHTTVVAAENALTGTPRAGWDLASPNLGGVATLQGFCDGFSADKTETVTFKIAQSDGAGWSAQVYRLGWYGGNGARLYDTLTPTGSQLAASQAQPAPGDADPNTTRLSADCGNWATTLTWTPPAWAPSGIYILRLNRTGGGASHTMFILRDDARPADLMLMPSDSTWNAYNAFGGLGANLYGGNSLYYGTAVDQYHADCARQVSYNRPVVNRGAADAGRSYGAVKWSTFFTGEYPMLRFVERNGHDVKYYGCLDAAGDPTGTKLASVKTAMAVGHSEYWSDGMRAGWEAAKTAGTNLFFCASNEVFWRLVGSNTDTAGRPRTWECFKSTIAARASTSRAEWTGTWRDPGGAGKGGNQPENTLTGTVFVVNGLDLRALAVPHTGGYSQQPIWRHTTVAALTSGQSWTSPAQILGFEWDTYGPAGTSGAGGAYMAAPHPRAQFCSDVTYTISSGMLLTDAGDVYDAGGTATHRLVVHPGGNGGIVFGTGSINWALGVDNANTYQTGADNTTPVIQQATVNMLVDMGATPASLMPGLTSPTPVDWYLDADLPTGTVTAQASVPTPTVDAGGGASKTAATVTAVAAVTEPHATGGATRAPATVGATAAITVAAVRTSSLVKAATVSALATIPFAFVGSVAPPKPGRATVHVTSTSPTVQVTSPPSAVQATSPPSTVRITSP